MTIVSGFREKHRPEPLVVMGPASANHVMGRRAAVGRLRGKERIWLSLVPIYGGIPDSIRQALKTFEYM